MGIKNMETIIGRYPMEKGVKEEGFLTPPLFSLSSKL
jgi:hypothetical protein